MSRKDVIKEIDDDDNYVRVVDRKGKAEKIKITRSKQTRKDVLLRRISIKNVDKVRYILDTYFPSYPYK